jgi:hypothetical protein
MILVAFDNVRARDAQFCKVALLPIDRIGCALVVRRLIVTAGRRASPQQSCQPAMLISAKKRAYRLISRIDSLSQWHELQHKPKSHLISINLSQTCRRSGRMLRAFASECPAKG